MSSLAKAKCIPCGSGGAAAPAEKKRWLKDIPKWSLKSVQGVPTLTRVFDFPDFKRAWMFVDRVSKAAERENHHPSLLLEWGKVTVGWNTHKIKNLHRNDFVMAAKTDTFYKPTKE